MLVALICNCHSAPGLVRQFLASQHHPDPFSVRLYRGEEARAFASKHGLEDILGYLKNRSSYAILLGWSKDSSVLSWADINHSNPHEIIKAETIVARFK